jgi:hypothetical protein
MPAGVCGIPDNVVHVTDRGRALISEQLADAVA